MESYKQKIDMYFELKGLPESSRESYSRRMRAFLVYMKKQNNPIEDMTLEDIQQYILYLKKERDLSAGTINNYICLLHCKIKCNN